MGNKTVKRLAILIGIIAILGGGGYLLWAFQVERLAHGVVAQAEQAEKEGKYEQAIELYRQHLAVMPGDLEVQIKYADALLKGEKTSKRQEEALAIYDDLLRQFPVRDDVRRRAADLTFEIGSIDKARLHLDILLKTARDDGHLEYLRGRCAEVDKEFEQAEKYYAAAVEHKGPERFEAVQRRAVLLRDRLGKADEAKTVMEEMVKAAPEDYRAYLARGEFRQGPDGKGGGDDFRKALELAPPDRPEVYLKVARAIERESKTGIVAARQVLDKGLAAAPKSVELYVALADLEQRAGRPEKAIEALELGLKALPEDINLRGQLAMFLADRGQAESGRLLLHIGELERQGAPRPFTQYLNACYQFNNRDVAKARQLLMLLQPDVARIPFLKSKVDLLLARCHAEMGEGEQQQEAMQRALSANPTDPRARTAMIQAMLSRGDLDGVIREYREIYARQPDAVRVQLASLLMDRNRRLPVDQRQWAEVRDLLDAAIKASPDAIDPKLLRIQMLQNLADGEQGNAKKEYEKQADDAIETIRKDFPDDVKPWMIHAELLIGRREFDAAQASLDRARQKFGDRVELRLVRVRLAAARPGPQAVAALKELGRGLEAFSREDRRRLLPALAGELIRQRDLQGATAALLQLASDEPQSLPLRLQLLELALQSGDGKLAEEQVRKIEELDEQSGHLYRAEYLAWQARRATDPAAKEKARAAARGILTELRARRRDWARVPLALARLDEEESAEAGLEPARKKEKLESAIASYRQAIDLGLRDAVQLRHYIQLLFAAGRGGEALEFYSQMPAVGQASGDLGRVASRVAIANRDFQQAEDIAKKDVAARPEDFQARIWLSRVLLDEHKNDEAEKVIRQGVDAAKADPDRWIWLVQVLLMTRQIDKAERAVKDAEARLADTKPLALAQCCQIVGKALQLAEPDRAKAWYAQARTWFDKAQQALKDPADLSVKRALAAFLLETKAPAEAEPVFKDILARTADGKSPALTTWARRGLAQAYVTADPPRTAEALALFAGKTGHGDDADDLRVLSQIHEVQGTPEGRRQAIADLESLVGGGSATPEDRLRLALLLEAVDDWTRAREQYGELVRETEDRRDAETIRRRPVYLSLFVEGLIRHHKTGNDSDLAEARGVVEKLKTLHVNPMAVMILEARIDKAANQIEAADKRIRDFAVRPDVTTTGRLDLARQADRIGLYDAAEWVLRRVAEEAPPTRDSLPNRAALADFLAHRGKVKEAVDICEGLWADPARREAAAGICIGILCGDPSTPVDEEQIRRVVGWFERAVAENPKSMVYLVGKGNLYERLGDYPRAEAAYRSAIKINDRDGMASNNLAWLIALREGRVKEKEALDLINSAIRVKGPHPDYLDTRGMIYVFTGQGRRAIADLEAASRAAPSPSKYFHLAQAYLVLKDKTKARKALEDGKARGLPTGLHRLEVAEYRKVASELGVP